MVFTVPSAQDRGLQLLREGSVAEGIEFLLQAVAEDPADVALYLYLAYAYARQEDFDKSIGILQQAIDVAPESAKVHYNLGVAYHKAHNLTQAKEEYLRAVNLDPNYSAAKTALETVTGSPEGSSEADSGPT